MIRFDQNVCHDLEAALRREWLETNGLGGFASSTILGLNTRRYHGLLVAALRPPVERFVLLSKLEEALVIDGRRYELSANQYPGVIHPQGFQYLKQFRLDPFPRFTYEVEGIEIEKSVFMIAGENSVVIQYEVRSASDATDNGRLTTDNCRLEVRPLIAFRDYHGTTHENGALNPYVQTETRLATVAPYQGLPPLTFAHDADELEATGFWFKHFEYRVEHERGLDWVEDLFSPFVLRFDLSRRSHIAVIVSTERRDVARAREYEQAETNRRRAILSSSLSDDEFVHTLVTAADQFIVARDDQKTVSAGYHWFTEWGAQRDDRAPRTYARHRSR